MSDYMLNCINELSSDKSVEVCVVRRSVDVNSAPYDFDTFGFVDYAIESLDAIKLLDLAERFSPDLIVCSGWSQKLYIDTIRARHSSCRAVLAMDNQWHGTPRQFAGCIYARVLLKRIFDFVWVPGARQFRFARRLGFSESKVVTGLYVANSNNFTPIFETIGISGPVKRLVFVGRYAKEKGIELLWRAFANYHSTRNSDLELLCIGTGPLYQRRLLHDKITHLGFVQPSELKGYLAGGGVFVLPSLYEPWGVVVQEFAFGGLPIIVSDAVGAGDKFVNDGNGIIVRAGSITDLTDSIGRIDNMSSDDLRAMSLRSRSLAADVTTEQWCESIKSFLK